jgi:hypothetical protein
VKTGEDEDKILLSMIASPPPRPSAPAAGRQQLYADGKFAETLAHLAERMLEMNKAKAWLIDPVHQEPAEALKAKFEGVGGQAFVRERIERTDRMI